MKKQKLNIVAVGIIAYIKASLKL